MPVQPACDCVALDTVEAVAVQLPYTSCVRVVAPEQLSLAGAGGVVTHIVKVGSLGAVPP